MALRLIKAGEWATPNYSIRSLGLRYLPAPRCTERQHWQVEATTDPGRSIYPKASTPLLWRAATDLVSLLERRLMGSRDYPPPPDGPTTAATLTAYREYLYPASTLRAGQEAIGAVLYCGYTHVRQMEHDLKPVTPRNQHALRDHAAKLMSRIRSEARAAATALAPFALLHEALSQDMDEPQEETHGHDCG